MEAETAPYAPNYGLASSADGSQLYGAAYPSRETVGVCGSKNSGRTWTSLGLIYGLTAAGEIACSADGSIVLVGAESTIISINGGASWLPGPGPANLWWRFLVCGWTYADYRRILRHRGFA